MTAKEIEWLIRQRYKPPEHEVVFQVGDKTGTQIRRHLDAIAMQLYPSRGLSLIGMEIKVDRQDLKREIDNPDKADEVAKYLDYFYIVCPAELNLVGLEVPYGWGIQEATEKGLKTVHPAQQIMMPEPLDRGFLAALFRTIGREDAFRAGKLIEASVQKIKNDMRLDLQSHIERIERDHSERVIWATTVISKVKEAGFNWEEIKWSGHFAGAVTHALKNRSLTMARVEAIAKEAENFAKSIREEAQYLAGIQQDG